MFGLVFVDAVETGSLSIALVILQLNIKIKLASNSEYRNPSASASRVEGLKNHVLPSLAPDPLLKYLITKIARHGTKSDYVCMSHDSKLSF